MDERWGILRIEGCYSSIYEWDLQQDFTEQILKLKSEVMAEQDSFLQEVV